MRTARLKFAMFGTLALIIGASTLFFAAITTLVGGFSLFSTILLAIVFNLAQWLTAPYLIDRMYKAKEAAESDQPRLYRMVRSICQRTGIAPPRIMIADMQIPNAFAYGSPVAGKRIAVTRQLLNTLEEEEVEAVIGHEIGHLKHRDTQVMMFASVLPVIFFYLGYSLMLSGGYGRNQRNAGSAALIGITAMAAYYVLSLSVLGLSRLREYTPTCMRWSTSMMGRGSSQRVSQRLWSPQVGARLGRGTNRAQAHSELYSSATPSPL